MDQGWLKIVYVCFVLTFGGCNNDEYSNTPVFDNQEGLKRNIKNILTKLFNSHHSGNQDDFENESGNNFSPSNIRNRERISAENNSQARCMKEKRFDEQMKSKKYNIQANFPSCG